MNGIFLSLSNTSNFGEYPNPGIQFMIGGKRNGGCCVDVHMGYRIIVLRFPGAIRQWRGESLLLLFGGLWAGSGGRVHGML